MILKQRIVRLLLHIAFWSCFVILFIIQNVDSELSVLLKLATFLAVSAIVSYVNLYALMTHFLFKKKHLLYFILLLTDIFIGASFITLIFPQTKALGNMPSFAQNFINLSFIVLITCGLKLIREKYIKQLRIRETENKQLKMELSLLKSQINPHFLFNTLNNLYGLIKSEKNDDAAEITLRLSDLMRYLLESIKKDKVSLKKEVKFLQDYIALEKIRLTSNTQIEFKVSGIQHDLSIAPLLFIAIAENVFKHGFGKFNEDPKAHFHLALQDNELYFESKNTFSKDNHELSRYSGTGLKNLRKRLDILYPNNYILQIDKSNNTYQINLNITL